MQLHGLHGRHGKVIRRQSEPWRNLEAKGGVRDPQAPRLPFRKNKGYGIDVPESGIARNNDWRVHAERNGDEFYYRSVLPSGKTVILLCLPNV